MITEGTTRNLAQNLCQGTMTRVLTSALHISAGEAAGRVRAAETLAERMTHDRAAAGTAAAAPGRQATHRGGLRRERRHCDPGVGAGDQARVRPRPDRRRGTTAGRSSPPSSDRRTCAGWPSRWWTDRPGRHPPRRRSYSRTAGSSGCDPPRTADTPGEFRLTSECGAKLLSLLEPLAKPRVNSTRTERGSWSRNRTRAPYGQRMHDALNDMCDRLLRSNNAVPDSGGTPATVIVTIDLDGPPRQDRLRRRL